jgi:thymidine phosphorylase
VVLRADAGALGRAATLLGAGRLRKEERIAPGAGIMLAAKVGTPVSRGDLLCTLHYDDGARAAAAEPLAMRAFQIGARAPRPTPLVLETLG